MIFHKRRFSSETCHSYFPTVSTNIMNTKLCVIPFHALTAERISMKGTQSIIHKMNAGEDWGKSWSNVQTNQGYLKASIEIHTVPNTDRIQGIRITDRTLRLLAAAPQPLGARQLLPIHIVEDSIETSNPIHLYAKSRTE